MIALGTPSHRTTTGGPIMGRSYLPQVERSIMAKLGKWLGLTDRPSGIYIRPHEAGGYSYGRWSREFLGHYRWEHLGQAATVEACRAALQTADAGIEARTRLLNKRGKRRG